MEIKNMPNPADNPLRKHFRQPAIYLKLPSQGQFYPESSIDIPHTGEIPVYPMTVKDELTLKTPDALMSGIGMIEVIKSCCPNIKNPWDIPAIDVDTIFIALRLASYGEGMDINSKCPHCNADNEHTIDLRIMLDNLKVADYSRKSLIDDLMFLFKPQRYEAINQTNIIAYEQQRIIDGIINNDSLSEEEKSDQFKISFQKLKDMNIDVVVNSIKSIATDDGEVVTDKKQIAEFLSNCSRKTYEEIKHEIQYLVDSNKLPPIDLTCEECKKDYQTGLEFDQANFFG
jgi:hypothetical protein